LWPISGYYPCICLRKIRTTMKNLSRESLFPSRDLNQHLANTNQRNYVSTNLLVRQKYCSCTFIFNVLENVNTSTCVRDLNTSPTEPRHAQKNEAAAQLQIPRYGGTDGTPTHLWAERETKTAGARAREQTRLVWIILDRKP
jgi:hypothetical protein